MSQTIPPINNWYNGSPFNASNWIIPDNGLTVSYANANYLKFPISQTQTENITSLKVIGTTEATNISSGSCQVLGGVGITKSAYVGGNLTVLADVTSANSISGSYTSADTVNPLILNQITPDYIYYNKLTTNYSSVGAPTLSGDDIGTILSTSAFVGSFTTTLINLSAGLTAPIGTFLLTCTVTCPLGSSCNTIMFFARDTAVINNGHYSMHNQITFVNTISSSFSFIYQNTSTVNSIFYVKGITTSGTVPIQIGSLFQMTRIA